MKMENESYLSLYELNGLVRDVLETSMPRWYWVKAEISDLREVGGHCYIELIEKEERTNTPIAKAHACCWRNKWTMVRQHFMRVAQMPLARGMKTLFRVHAQFHENYGFSWIIEDIDPTFTLGDMARKRQRIVKQLKEEGVFDDNRSLPLPLFAQRIAVISSEGAAGYGDFTTQLAHNEFGYHFSATLFPAIMQGEEVERSIIAALDRIHRQQECFDCVVITRGGGASSDLSGFDALELARNVANFPLPVITAIGHERDESVLDMIAKVRVKTPTAAAAFLIDHLHHVDLQIENARDRIVRYVEQRMRMESNRISHLSVRIPSLFTVVRTVQTSRLDRFQQRMTTALLAKVERSAEVIRLLESRLQPATERSMMKEHHRLEMLIQRTTALDPQRILDRGYSITLLHGKAVRDASQLASGDTLETRLSNGKVRSVVE